MAISKFFDDQDNNDADNGYGVTWEVSPDEIASKLVDIVAILNGPKQEIPEKLQRLLALHSRESLEDPIELDENGDIKFY